MNVFTFFQRLCRKGTQKQTQKKRVKQKRQNKTRTGFLFRLLVFNGNFSIPLSSGQQWLLHSLAGLHRVVDVQKTFYAEVFVQSPRGLLKESHSCSTLVSVQIDAVDRAIRCRSRNTGSFQKISDFFLGFATDLIVSLFRNWICDSKLLEMLSCSCPGYKTEKQIRLHREKTEKKTKRKKKGKKKGKKKKSRNALFPCIFRRNKL